MRKRKEIRGDEASHMRAIVSAWVIWAMIILGLVTSWAVQTPVLEILPSLSGKVAPAPTGSNAAPPIAPFATASGPIAGAAVLLRRERED